MGKDDKTMQFTKSAQNSILLLRARKFCGMGRMRWDDKTAKGGGMDFWLLKEFHWLLWTNWLPKSAKNAPSHPIDCGKRLWRLVFGKWGESVVGVVAGGGSVFM